MVNVFSSNYVLRLQSKNLEYWTETERYAYSLLKILKDIKFEIFLVIIFSIINQLSTKYNLI